MKYFYIFIITLQLRACNPPTPITEKSYLEHLIAEYDYTGYKEITFITNSPYDNKDFLEFNYKGEKRITEVFYIIQSCIDDYKQDIVCWKTNGLELLNIYKGNYK
jgi:hypothetical protein